MKEIKILNQHLYERSPYKDFDKHKWEYFMNISLEMAKTGYKEEEVPVGAVLINPKGEIIARSKNLSVKLCDPTAHAEILVLREGAKISQNYRLNNTVLITTLEPCIMCFGAMIQARINGLVFGTKDPKSGSIVSKLDASEVFMWANHRFWIIYDILADKCSKILKDFFRQKR